jgi:hypothetical protein
MSASVKYTALVKRPTPDSINSGLSPLPQSRMIALFGAPASKKTVDCTTVTNSKLAGQLVTESVGPFRVTGHRAAVRSLRAVFDDVRTQDPELYALIGTAGMLCARLVRGSNTSWSNHSWGFAIDLTIGGVLDRRGDDNVQVGLLRLYPYFHRHGWFWGAEFPTEDGMHFEVALQTLNKWVEGGIL